MSKFIITDCGIRIPIDLYSKFGVRSIVKRKWLHFEGAREFVKSLNLKSLKEWNKYCKSGNKPRNIPSNPYISYKDEGWMGMKNWMGRDFLSFEEAREFVRKLELKSTTHWRKHWIKNKKPFYITVSPDRLYKDKGWINWGWFAFWLIFAPPIAGIYMALKVLKGGK